MNEEFVKKGIVCGIVLLFVLVSIVPSIGSRSIRDDHVISFTIQAPDIVFGEVEVSQGVFTSLELPGCGFSTVVGEAKLPLIRKTFQIPQGAAPVLEITSLSWETLSLSSKGLPRYIIPVQPSVRKISGEKQTADFVFNPQYYSQNRFTPSEIASIAEEGEIRGHRFILVEVSPVQYNPVTGEIRILKSCDIRIDLPGSDIALTNTLTKRYHSNGFDQLFQRIFDNYGQFGMQAKNTEGYLIVVYDSFYEETLPLANSKQTMGYEVTITKTSQIPGGPTKENIAAYIADAYTTWSIPPAFVLLVGDVPQIPTWTGTATGSAADLYYVTVTPGNYFPDLFIGRFPAATATQVSIMVQKTVDFEQQLLPSYDFLKKTTFIASSDFGQLAEQTHNYVIHTFLEPNDYSYDKIYQASGGTTSQIINAINDGRILVVYSGHGYPGGWGCISFNQNNIRFDLTNEGMYPFVCSHACTTNPFDQSECFGETWLREENKGALAFWGSSTYTYWYEDDILEKGMFEAWWQGGLCFLGGMTDEALFRVWQNYSGGGLSRFYYEAYNLNGDPSVDITGSYTPGEPPSVTVTRPNGGEVFEYGTNELISWSAIGGDDPVDFIQLFYSIDAGLSWKSIATGLANTGSYWWSVPNEHSSECLVRIRAVDIMGRSGEDVSDAVFTIVGVPPAPPVNLRVEHVGTSVETLFEDDVEGGDLGYITGRSHVQASTWAIRQHGASSGVRSWDFGDGLFNKQGSGGQGMLSWLISPAIEIPATSCAEYGVWFTFQHWRDWGDSSLYDAGNVKISTSGSGGPWSLLIPQGGYDGVVPASWDNPLGGQQAWGGYSNWVGAVFDLTGFIGQSVHIRWDAGVEAWNGFFGAGWRVDDLFVEALVVDEEGTAHNLVLWDGSPDETIGGVSHYTVYRSEYQSGPWDPSSFVESVGADGSSAYEFVDVDKGLADDVVWWYVVRAVGVNGLEELNTNAVSEPHEHDHYRDLTDFPHYISRVDSGAMVMKMMLDYLRWNSTTHPEGPPSVYSEQDLYDTYRDYLVFPELYFDDDSVIDEYELAFGLVNEIRHHFPVPPEWENRGVGYYGYFFAANARDTALDALKWACTWIDYPIDYHNDIRLLPVPRPGHTNHVPVAVPTGGDYDNWMVIRGIHTDRNTWPYGQEFEVYGFWMNDPNYGGLGNNWYLTAQYFMDNYFEAMTMGPNVGQYVVVTDPPDLGLGDAELETMVERNTISLGDQVSATSQQLRFITSVSRVGFSDAANHVIMDIASQALSRVYPDVITSPRGVQLVGSEYVVIFGNGMQVYLNRADLVFTRLWNP